MCPKSLWLQGNTVEVENCPLLRLQGSLYYQPKQCPIAITIREILQNYHRICIKFDPKKNENFMIPGGSNFPPVCSGPVLRMK